MNVSSVFVCQYTEFKMLVLHHKEDWLKIKIRPQISLLVAGIKLALFKRQFCDSLEECMLSGCLAIVINVARK